MSNLWLQIKNTKDAYDLNELIDSIDESNVNEIIDLLPELLDHKSWIVRTDALEIIGEFKLGQFTSNVLDVLKKERNPIVIGNALTALFDIDRGKSTQILLNEYIEHKVVRVRLCALSLLYVKFQKTEYLEQIAKILLRSNCNYLHKAVFFHIMTDYLNVKKYPDVITLLRSVLHATDPSLGISKDIDEFLRSN